MAMLALLHSTSEKLKLVAINVHVAHALSGACHPKADLTFQHGVEREVEDLQAWSVCA
jgi:hypothetical protein